MLSDYESSYDQLLRLSDSCVINVRLKRNVCVEIYKTLNDLNSSFIREICETRKTKIAVRERYKINFEIPKVNQTSFDIKSLRFYGPKIWNCLPNHIKSAENLLCFKNLIKSWNGSFYNCNVMQEVVLRELNLDILKKIYKIYEDSCRFCFVLFFLFFFCMIQLFTEKISKQTLICYV